MSNKKQTAVEFAVEKLEKLIPSGNQLAIRIILNQAKEIEKEQIIHTWNTRAKIDGILTFTDNRTAEQYYKENYEHRD